jgi:tRNA 2-thiouridine synthesizing protein A
LRLRRALETIGSGGVVHLLADDPLAKIDIPHFVKANGHQIVGLTVDDGVLRACIRKGV